MKHKINKCQDNIALDNIATIDVDTLQESLNIIND